MAEAEAGQEGQARKSGRRNTLKLGGVFGGIMLAEALIVFFLVRSFGDGPQEASAAGEYGLNAAEGQARVPVVEVEVVRFRAQNEKSRRVIVYDLAVFATVEADKSEDFKALIESKKNTIQDQFSSIVRAADPQRFMEPDLATLRQQFKATLTELAGEQMPIQQVLIPSLVSYSDG